MEKQTKNKKLIIVGDSAFAEIAYEYFTHDSEYKVVAFAVELNFITKDSLFGLPVVPLEKVADRFEPAKHHFFAALVYNQMNDLRTRLYQKAKSLGFSPASYVSKQAFVWSNCKLGEHCFVFENNVIQPFVEIGINNVIWSGNHIGHHSKIGDNNFISSHVVISGFVNIGNSCFLGVNSTFANNLTVGNRCLFGAGSLVLADVPDETKVIGTWKKVKEDNLG